MTRRFAFVLALMLAGCRTHAVFRKIDPSFNRMQVQPRGDAYEASAFFPDGLTMRQPPRGTVPFLPEPPRDRPPALDRDLLERGKNRFEIFCAPCHGVLGDGNTVVAEHMGRPPPSLHEQRIVRLGDDALYEIIRGGYGYMPPYAAKLPVEDRWAVVNYVHALQLSQNAPIAALPPALRSELDKEER